MYIVARPYSYGPSTRVILSDPNNSLRTFSCIWTYSLPLRMFYFSIFILDSSLSSFSFPLVPSALGLRPAPLLSTSRPLSRFEMPFIFCFLSD